MFMLNAASAPASNAVFYWKIIQGLFWLVGIALLYFMLFHPSLGVTLFWNILIPVAPALLVVGTGIWRNICPLSTTALIPDKFGISKKKILSNSQRATLNLMGVVFLFLIIPLRHVLFNNSGQATAAIILGLSAIALASGLIFERKSGWCSGLCPVHPVEKLYGSGVAFTLPNAHCNECVRCSIPCPDSTPNMQPTASDKSTSSKVTELLLVGAFPGYIYGWFQVPDYPGAAGWQQLQMVYGYPLIGAIVTLSIYLLLHSIVTSSNKKLFVNIFAAAAVSCYYWFRLPMLFGFGSINNNGMLVDLTGSLPSWSMLVLTLATTSFFFWWMVVRTKVKRSWSVRPVYAAPIEKEMQESFR
jgi:hypothetical protein